MNIYKKRHEHKSAKARFLRTVETSIKASMIMLFAMPFSWVASAFWYFCLYKNDIHLGVTTYEIAVTAAWIPVFALFYGLFASAIISRVFEEYKQIRHAIKTNNIEAFMCLCDEDVSPLMHVLLSILGLFVLLGFMLLEYPEPIGGFLLVGSTSFIIAFIFFVISEIDDPLGGVWFIKYVPAGWAEINPRQWRNEHYRQAVMQKLADDKKIETAQDMPEGDP